MKKQTYHVSSREDESIHITCVSGDNDVQGEVDFWNNRWEKLGYGKTKTTEKVLKKNIPNDGYFKKAWRLNNGIVGINMNIAKTIQMDRIRVMRDDKMKELDIETMKGVDVTAQKQVLRDLPKTFDLSGAKTPEALKLLIPTEVL